MKRIIVFLVIGITILSCSNNENGVKPLLLEQLDKSYAVQDWYVPVKKAIDGLNDQQASWKDSTDNHSIKENVSHMIFWNERVLRAFKEENVPDFKDNNEVTFESLSELDWAKLVMKLDTVQTEWKQVVENGTTEQIKKWSSEIANMAGHNAYHTGQIIYIRKRNGWWR